MFRVLLAAAAACMLTACQTHVRYDNAARLIARPDFEDAATSAPEWVEDALTTINNLELELERQ